MSHKQHLNFANVFYGLTKKQKERNIMQNYDYYVCTLEDVLRVNWNITPFVTETCLTFSTLGIYVLNYNNVEVSPMIAAMVNNKGGVGKTVCSVNLAAALANRKKKVLLIDNDPQCNATSLLLGDTTPENTLYEMFTEGMPVKKCIYPTEFGVDIIPNAQITSQIEADLYLDTAKSYALLRDMVRDYATEHYDITLIDCVPSLGLWVIQAMSAADGIIVPIEAGSRFSLDGLASIYTSIESIRATKLNKELRFLKTLVNKVDMRTSSSKVVIEKIHELYPGYVFETTIPTNDAIKQAELSRTTVLKYDPQSSGAKRFRALADELIEMIRADREQLELPNG